MGSKYRSMDPAKLEKAIEDSKNNRSVQYSKQQSISF
jgi:hypothetical protein